MTAPGSSGFALSRQQLRVRAICLAEPFRRGIVSGTFRIAGAFDEAALRLAVARASQPYEVLRTAIRRPPGMQLPLQVIDDSLTIAVTVATLAVEDAIDARLRAEREAPLDLATGPLVRIALFSLAPVDHILSIVGSAMVLDTTSLGFLARVLCGAPDQSHESPLQYVDYAGWQADALAADEPRAVQARGRWNGLRGETGVRLPLQRAGNFSGRIESLSVPVDAAAAEFLASANPRSVRAAALAAWQILVAREGGQPHPLIGVECDGRALAELGGALGPIASVLPIRSTIDLARTFDHAVRSIDDALTEAESIQEYFPTADATQLEFETSIQFAYSDARSFTAGALRVRPEVVASDVDRFAARLVVTESDQGITLRLEHDAALLDRRAAESVAASLGALLGDASRRRDVPVDALALLSDAQRTTLLAALDNSQREGRSMPAHVAIAEQAIRRPGGVAVVGYDATLTFGELATAAANLSRVLAGLGLGDGDVVAICLHRSAGIPVAMLGVLQSGAAFLALDPAYPSERLALMLRDAGARAIIVDDHVGSALPPHDLPIVTVDGSVRTNGAAIAKGTTRDLRDAAYIVYTSGTTGTPRGIAVRRRALEHYLPAIGDALGINDDDVYLHTASIAFSSSIRQILMPLARGAAVVVATDDERRDATALLDTIAARGVTAIDLVPSQQRAVTQALRGLDATSRRRVLGSGLRLIASASEALSSDLPRAWRREFGFSGRLVNMFGTTETAGIVCITDIGDEVIDAPEVSVVPVGRPIAGVRAYVTDDHLQLVAPGVVGELLVGGASTENEFLADPERTAQRFVADPVRTGSGTVFRTRDRVRVRLDGALEYVGRTDNLVKVRGVRIELAEIEAALARFAGAREVAAAIRPDAGGEPQVVAYLVSSGGAIDAVAVRQFAAVLLPAAMVPGAVVAIDALPLTPNGKLDRAALPMPGTDGRGTRAGVAPRDVVEDALSTLWGTVLRSDTVGVEDDFFMLGGHSLLATQLVARVREAFRAPITLRTLFEAPTVAGMARALRSVEPVPGLSERVAAVLIESRGSASLGADA